MELFFAIGTLGSFQLEHKKKGSRDFQALGTVRVTFVNKMSSHSCSQQHYETGNKKAKPEILIRGSSMG